MQYSHCRHNNLATVCHKNKQRKERLMNTSLLCHRQRSVCGAGAVHHCWPAPMNGGISAGGCLHGVITCNDESWSFVKTVNIMCQINTKHYFTKITASQQHEESKKKTQKKRNKNLVIANRSRVSCAHKTSRASIGLNITPWPWNVG